MADLTTRSGIHETALRLAAFLEANYKDKIEDDAGQHWISRPEWTSHIFSMLRTFCQHELGLDAEHCYHNSHPSNKTEFLWDFIAVEPERGLLLVCESEHQARSQGDIKSLEQDFDKLLYPYAPLRVLICKADTRADTLAIKTQLEAYAATCSKVAAPGSVLLLHFHLWHNERTISFLSQTAGEPTFGHPEPLTFHPIQR